MASACLIDDITYYHLNRSTFDQREKLITADELFTLNGLTPGIVREPRHNDAVSTHYSYELLNNGKFNKIPLLVGFNSEEENFFAFVFEYFSSYIPYYDREVERLVPITMNIKDLNTRKKVGQKIKDHYLGTSESFEKCFTCFLHYVSDGQFVRAIRQYVRLTSKFVNVYYYELTYEGRLGNPNRGELRGVGHTEDFNYIFRTSTNYPNLTKGDWNTRYRMVKMWTNFAKYGNPTPAKESLLQNVKWNVAASTDTLSYLNIGADLSMETDPHPYDMHFWDYLYKTFSSGPYDTY